MAYIKNKYIATADSNVFLRNGEEEVSREDVVSYLNKILGRIGTLQETIHDSRYVIDLDTLVGTGYSYARQAEYPDIGDQLDDLFRKGAFSTEMAATLQAVKDKYPKE